MGWVLTAMQVFTIALEIGFDHKDAAIITCIAEHESSFNTRANNSNRNGSFDHGLMQINDLWLREGVACHGLDVYEPTQALLCTKRILMERGFDAWVAYNRNKKKCDEYEVSDEL